MDTRKNLLIDVAAFVIYVIVANPALTGLGLHEWISLGLLVVFFVHVAVHIDWFIEAVRVSLRSRTWKRMGSLVLNVCILIAFIICVVSGLCISGSVLPALGYFVEGYYFWDPLHAMFAKALLALLVIHIVVHGSWLVKAVQKRGRAER